MFFGGKIEEKLAVGHLNNTTVTCAHFNDSKIVVKLSITKPKNIFKNFTKEEFEKIKDQRQTKWFRKQNSKTKSRLSENDHSYRHSKWNKKKSIQNQKFQPNFIIDFLIFKVAKVAK